ncbi:MAG TPA: glucokinase [Vicinamibacterales bacterium]|nr:glucokinase [Vicinamibacterales bacterium]
MLLAGDVGGTKTLLGLFSTDAERPAPVEVGEFVTLDYDGLEPMVREFLRVRNVESRALAAACFGVAGAVTDQVARLTNVPWLVDAERVGAALGVGRTVLLNDLEALAYAVPVLAPEELAVLQQGVAVPGGNAAVIAAGTGLGEAMLHNVDGRFVPAASEGGHADFAARTPREMEMVLELTRVFGRVGVEHVVSGPGLVNLYQFTHQAFGAGPTITPNSIAPARLCEAVGDVTDAADLPAKISSAAMQQRCPRCVESMDMFVSAYGAETGNLALRTVSTAGIYVGGGIAPKILRALKEGSFLGAFRAKEPMADLLATIPVAVILNRDAALLGAAVHAMEASRQPW